MFLDGAGIDDADDDALAPEAMRRAQPTFFVQQPEERGGVVRIKRHAPVFPDALHFLVLAQLRRLGAGQARGKAVECVAVAVDFPVGANRAQDGVLLRCKMLGVHLALARPGVVLLTGFGLCLGKSRHAAGVTDGRACGHLDHVNLGCLPLCRHARSNALHEGLVDVRLLARELRCGGASGNDCHHNRGENH